jgi:hypothetical protein
MQRSPELEVPSATSRASDQAVWPWQAEPYRLWSLLDMRTFDVSELAIGACYVSTAGSLAKTMVIAKLAVHGVVTQAFAHVDRGT